MADLLKILVVDDEEDFSHFIKLNLEMTKRYRVLTANSGREGIALAKAEKPDLILLDILMPEMHGTEVAAQLMVSPSTGSIPIIYLTAVATKKEVESNEGMIGGRMFIAKPVTQDELVKVIESVLKKSS